ncbi:MAG: phosphate ABC transporter substrate-binding protein [Clostridiales bacterium]|nr:phosphate ABC transporter substrate-binding protein [Clostridiales bacterium]
MKNRKLKVFIGSLLLMATGISMIGCGSNSSTNGGEGDSISGSISLSGSSALFPLVEASIDGFNEEYPDVEISAQAGGSGTGLTQVSEGTVDIGNSDVFAEEKLDADKAKELSDHKVVAQGFAVAINKKNKVTNLTKQQIQDIFSGKITNWKDVGGDDKEITVIHRPASSGTRATFVKTMLNGDKELENDSIGATQDTNGAVLKAMEDTEGAISYLALSYMNGDEAKDKVSAVKIDGVEASKENITTGKYAFWAYGHMYTKGEATKEQKAFIDYIMSDDNKKNIEELGYISGSEMKVK